MRFSTATVGLGAPSWVYKNAALDLDFARGRYWQRGAGSNLASLLHVSRASAGWAENFDGSLQQFSAGLPRITGKGLLTEPSATNCVLHSDFSGATAGIVGSGGSLPADMSFSKGGATSGQIEIVSVLTDSIGRQRMRVRMTAINSTGSVQYPRLRFLTGTPASPGQTFTGSFYCWLLSSTHSVGAYVENTVGTDNGGISAVLGDGSRVIVKRTFALGTTTAARLVVGPALPAGESFDCTIEFALPQLEQNPFATSPIITSGSSLSRGEDGITLSSLSGISLFEGAWYAEWEERIGAVDSLDRFAVVARVDSNNLLGIGRNASNKGQFVAVADGAAQATLQTSGTLSALSVYRVAAAYAQNDFEAAFTALSRSSAISGSGLLPTGDFSVGIGGDPAGGNTLGGYLRRLVYVPKRVPQAALYAWRDHVDGLGQDTIPRAYFGMHTNKSTSYTTPQTPFYDLGQGSARLWDTGTNWRAIETAKGIFNWDKFDATVAAATSRGLSILYTLGQPPDWATGSTSSSVYGASYNSIPPASDSDWTDFISALVPRLPAGSAYEIWNEPNVSGFYSGTKARLGQLHMLAYDTIKSLDPTAVVVSASPTGTSSWSYMNGYLAPSVLAKTDAVGVHTYIYPGQPEAILDLLSCIRLNLDSIGAAALPIWNTEYTWHDYVISGTTYHGNSNEIMPDTLAQSYIVRSLMMEWVGGAKRSYFYGMDYSWSMLRLLTDLSNPSVLSGAASAYGYTASLLLGAQIINFENFGQYYRVQYKKTDGRTGFAYWCPDGQTTSVDLSNFSSGKDVLGQAVALNTSYTLTQSPVFVE